MDLKIILKKSQTFFLIDSHLSLTLKFIDSNIDTPWIIYGPKSKNIPWEVGFPILQRVIKPMFSLQ